MQGLDGSREAVASKFAVPSYATSKDDVYLCAGGSLAIWATMNLLGEAGDNFLFPSPGFPLALTIAKSMGLEPRFYQLEATNKWSASVAEMEGLIDDRTRFILVNDPSNPLGATWSVEHKKEILQLSKRRNIPLLADEIYEGMIYTDMVPTFAELVDPQDADQITIFKCSGLTKRYLGPGWRMGWIILYASEARRSLLRPLLRGIFNVILMPNTVMQSAVPEILANGNNEIRMGECMQLMRKNQLTLKNGLEGKGYCTFGYSAGALYATILIDLQKLDPAIRNTIDLAKLLYAEQNVKIFPGDFFEGKVPFIRLVISCENAKIHTFL
jgi:tyrosine aminotransferase